MIAAITAVLWWFAFRTMQEPLADEDSELVFFDGRELESSLKSVLSLFPKEINEQINNTNYQATLVYFRDENCECTAFNDERVKRLINDNLKNNIRYIIIEKSETPYFSDIKEQVLLSSLPNDSLIHQVPASPAMAIFDENESLAYFGPHSLGPLCQTDDRFVESALQGIIENQPQRNISTLGYGCFCDWTEAS